MHAGKAAQDAPSAGNGGVPLQRWCGPIKHEDRLDVVEQQPGAKDTPISGQPCKLNSSRHSHYKRKSPGSSQAC